VFRQSPYDSLESAMPALLPGISSLFPP
jgi:hypothetical protein